MCPIIIGLMVLLLYYANAQISALSLSERIESELLIVAQGWELLAVLWPLVLFLFLLGVITVLLTFRVRAMLKEINQKKQSEKASDDAQS